MVKVIGPLSSTKAAGTLAKSVVFSRWKGRPYVRSRAYPRNPKTAHQAGMRAMFSALTRSWDGLHPLTQGTWQSAALIGVLTPFNAFMQLNQRRWGRYLAPCMSYDFQEGTGTPAEVHAYSAAGHVLEVHCGLTITQVNDGWGWLIHRHELSGFSPGPGNLVHAFLTVNIGDSTWLDAPREAGTYFYRMFSTTVDGGTADLGPELEATVLAL